MICQSSAESITSSGGAKVSATRGKRLCCRLTLVIRSPIDILMVTTIALVWTVNSMLSWGVRLTSPPSYNVIIISEDSPYCVVSQTNSLFSVTCLT